MTEIRNGPGMWGDIRGALTSTLVSLPLSMTIGVVAFAPLGGEHAIQGVVAGVYGAIILGAASAIFGAKTPLISGPRAASALILASLITQLMLSDALFFPAGQTTHYVVALAFFAIFAAGAVQLLAGALKVGNIVKYVPYPVIAGFVNSSALLIIFGQAWVLLDIQKENSFLAEDTIIDLVLRLGETKPLTMIPGVVAIVVMLAAGAWIKKIPSLFIGLISGTATYYGMQFFLDGYDIGTTLGQVGKNPVLGEAPQSLELIPAFPIVEMFQGLVAGGDPLAALVIILPAALAMAAMASLDTAVSLTALDEVTEKRSSFNRELIGQGIGNIAAASVGGLIGSGGMIRTKPGFDAGGRRPAMSLLVSGMMLATLLLLGHYIEFLPRAVIAGLIMVLGFQIFDRWSIKLLKSCCSRYIFQRKTALVDVTVILLVVAVALTFDLIMAVGVGILLSIIIFVSRMSRSVVRNVYRGPAIRSRNVWDRETQALLNQHGHKVAVLELEGPIFFGTAESLQTTVDHLIQDGAIYIVLDTKRVNDIDSTGSLALQRIQKRLKKAGGTLTLSYVLRERRRARSGQVNQERRAVSSPRHFWVYLKNSGAIDILGEDIFFPDTDTALTTIEEAIIRTARDAASEGAPRPHTAAILTGLTMDEIHTVRRHTSRRTFARGETVFSQGDDGTAVYYLSKGRVEILIKIHATGELKRVQTLMPGSIFGEMALLDAKPRAASVVAVDDAICYRLTTDAFNTIKSDHQDVALKIFNNICLMFTERVRSANAMIVELEK